MKNIAFIGYIGIIPNPFCKYTIDFSGFGLLEIERGLLTTTGQAYDLFPISNASYRASIIQKLFGLGDVTISVSENNTEKVVTLSNIKDAKYITGLLRNHHQEVMELYYKETNMIHLV